MGTLEDEYFIQQLFGLKKVLCTYKMHAVILVNDKALKLNTWKVYVAKDFPMFCCTQCVC